MVSIAGAGEEVTLGEDLVHSLRSEGVGAMEQLEALSLGPTPSAPTPTTAASESSLTLSMSGLRDDYLMVAKTGRRVRPRTRAGRTSAA